MNESVQLDRAIIQLVDKADFTARDIENQLRQIRPGMIF